MDAGQSSLHPFVRLSREDWARLPADASFALSEADLRKIGAHLSREEATQVYLPLSRLLHLHVGAAQSLYRAARAFLAREENEVPYVVGIAGSVAAGKSTVARVLRDLISRWPGRPEVGLVSTDGFLYPNRVLRSRGLMERKGFPGSYDLPLLLRFLADIKSGRDGVSAPIHSHLTYDILPDRTQIVGRPDVLIVEGLNMLEAGLPKSSEGHRVFVSDYCHRFAELSVEEARDVALRVWDEIDHPNLKENIEPTRDRARLILEKGQDHSVQSVRLRKM